MTQRRTLSPEDVDRLMAAKRTDEDAQTTRAWYQGIVVEMIDKSSYREVARLTGLSTNTLQRWKREAGK